MFIDYANDEQMAILHLVSCGSLHPLVFCCLGVVGEYGMCLSFHSGAKDERLGLSVLCPGWKGGTGQGLGQR